MKYQCHPIERRSGGGAGERKRVKVGEEEREMEGQKEKDARWPYQEYGLFQIKFFCNTFD